jgi:hypothetical protein
MPEVGHGSNQTFDAAQNKFINTMLGLNDGGHSDQ